MDSKSAGRAARLVAAAITALGTIYLIGAILFWRSSQLTNYLLYVATGVVAAVCAQKRLRSETRFSVNLFLVPLGIVELTLPETIVLAVIGPFVSAVALRRRLRHTRDSLVLLANEATAAAAAYFAYHSLIPDTGRTATVRLFLGGGAYFVTRTFPEALVSAARGGRRIGVAWREGHFWEFPYYLLGASTAGFISMRNAFLHWEVCILITPVLYVLYRAHVSRELTVAALEQRTREMEKAKNEAEAANHAKSEFLRNVSHELRTPMNGIIGMTAVALENPLPSEAQDCLETVRDSADSLLHLLNEILDFAKIEAGRWDLEQLTFDLRERMEHTCRPFHVAADQKCIQLECVVSQEVPEVLQGDPDRLAQVVRNLLGNALKFTEKGYVKVTVSVEELTSDHAVLHFTVADTGIGIPPDKLQAIFEPFTQADGSTTRKYGGTGLGLSICQRMVEKMGGAIWVNSALGSGSTFHFTCSLRLPCAVGGSLLSDSAPV